jgi:adenine-specific DNA-methyltransferase
VESYDEQKNVVTVVYNEADNPTRRTKTVWRRSAHDAGAGGTDLVNALIGPDKFSFPKSVLALRDTLGILTVNNPNALIVDFFAGSGTTFHAAAMLNAEDGGSRRTILVTNNEVALETQKMLAEQSIKPGDQAWEEQGIFVRATKPRIESVVTGIAAVTKEPIPARFKNANGTPMSNGLSENVEFLELTYQNPDQVSRGRQFAAISPLLWMKAGAIGQRVDCQQEDWILSDQFTYAVLFDIEKWRLFAEAVSARSQLTHVFIVTDSESVFQQIVAELPTHLVATQLYDDYLRTFAINAKERV